MNYFFLNKSKSSPYWQVIFLKNGKRTKVSTKTKAKAEAQKFFSEFKSKFNSGIKTLCTLKEFECEYVDWITPTHSKAYVNRSIKLSLKMLKEFAGSDIQLTDISVKLADRFFSQTYSRAGYSARLYLRTLKAAFNIALRWGMVEENVFTKIKPPKALRTIPIYIDEMEFQKILAATKEIYLRNIFEFGFYTGARANEILSMRWNNINFDERIITIRNTETFTTKNKQDRIIPINNKLFEILSSLARRKKAESDFIFYKVPGVKLNTEFVSKKFKASVKKAGLSEKIHLHSLRHSFASLLHQRGAPLTVVRDILGHNDIRTTMIYSHNRKENLVEAVQLIGNNVTAKFSREITAGGLSFTFNLN